MDVFDIASAALTLWDMWSYWTDLFVSNKPPHTGHRRAFFIASQTMLHRLGLVRDLWRGFDGVYVQDPAAQTQVCYRIFQLDRLTCSHFPHQKLEHVAHFGYALPLAEILKNYANERLVINQKLFKRLSSDREALEKCRVVVPQLVLYDSSPFPERNLLYLPFSL